MGIRRLRGRLDSVQSSLEGMAGQVSGTAEVYRQAGLLVLDLLREVTDENGLLVDLNTNQELTITVSELFGLDLSAVVAKLAGLLGLGKPSGDVAEFVLSLSGGQFRVKLHSDDPAE